MSDQKKTNEDQTEYASGADNWPSRLTGAILALAMLVAVVSTGCLAIKFEYSGSKKSGSAPAEEGNKATEPESEPGTEGSQ